MTLRGHAGDIRGDEQIRTGNIRGDGQVELGGTDM